jgi:AcrR family transcriptional regulator
VSSDVAPVTQTRRRGRPFGFDRDDVLSRAVLTFWRLGYEGASIRELTDAMGITAQSLYAAFDSKEALYCEALDYYGAHFCGFMREALIAGASVVTAFERFFRESARTFVSDDRPRGCMVLSASFAAELDRDVAAAHAAVHRQYRKDAIESRLAAGVASGEWRTG